MSGRIRTTNTQAPRHKSTQAQNMQLLCHARGIWSKNVKSKTWSIDFATLNTHILFLLIQ